MSVQREKVGWRIWIRWVLVSTMGFGAGTGLGMILAGAVVGVVSRDPQGGPVFGPGGKLIWGAVASGGRRDNPMAFPAEEGFPGRLVGLAKPRGLWLACIRDRGGSRCCGRRPFRGDLGRNHRDSTGPGSASF